MVSRRVLLLVAALKIDSKVIDDKGCTRYIDGMLFCREKSVGL